MSQLQESTAIMSEWGEYNVETFELYCKEKNEDTSVIYSPTKWQDFMQWASENNRAWVERSKSMNNITKLEQPRYVLEYIKGGSFHYVVCSEEEQEKYMQKYNVKYGTCVQTAEQLLETLTDKVGKSVALSALRQVALGDAVDI